MIGYIFLLMGIYTLLEFNRNTIFAAVACILIGIAILSSRRRGTASGTGTAVPRGVTRDVAEAFERYRSALASDSIPGLNAASEELIELYRRYSQRRHAVNPRAIETFARDNAYYYCGNRYRSALVEELLADERERLAGR